MSENMNLVTIEQVKDNLELINIKQYIPFAFKKKMVEEIIGVCTSVDENGVIHVDSALKQMAFEFSVVNQYTNLDLPDDNIEAYDLIKEYGIADYVFNKIDSNELSFIKNCLNEQINYILTINNSMENLVAKGIAKVANSFPDKKGWSKLIKEIFKGVNNINPDKLGFIKEAINWNNGVDKGK
jgi:hypothetical protein